MVEGTLFGRSEPRIVRYGVFSGEFDIEGNLLVIQAVDKQGVIGAVGSALAKRKINISHIQFARAQEGGEALIFMNTDSRADDAALGDLKALDSIQEVHRIAM